MMFKGTIEQIAAQAEGVLSSIAPGAYCVVQEWDDRIDCLVQLANGRVVGEMIAIAEATEQRIRDAGTRLRQWQLGIPVALHDELPPPVLLRRNSGET
jgi:hypothetical protein